MTGYAYAVSYYSFASKRSVFNAGERIGIAGDCKIEFATN